MLKKKVLAQIENFIENNKTDLYTNPSMYTFLYKDGKPVITFTSCKDYINDSFTYFFLKKGFRAPFVKQLKDVDVKNIDFRNPIFIFQIKKTPGIEKNIELANKLWQYLGGKGKTKLLFKKNKSDGFTSYVIRFPSYIYYMPPVLHLLVMCIRSGWDYNNNFLTSFKKTQDNTINSDSEYFKSGLVGIKAIRENGGVYKFFKYDDKYDGAKTWNVRFADIHGGNGINSFSMNWPNHKRQTY
jgi:hypothetical protein